MKNLLSVKNLHTKIDSTSILKGVSLSINTGEMHVVMGPNGSGKSTLAYALMGHPHYHSRATTITFDGRDIKKSDPDARARLGMFLGFQYPLTITGLSLSAFLPSAVRAIHGSKSTDDEGDILHTTLASKEAYEQMKDVEHVRKTAEKYLPKLQMREDMLYRSINEGFSGGEKKKAEILQMLMLEPKLAILDEPDSGLDVDALKATAQAIDDAHKKGTAVLLITHYERILKYLSPDAVHIMHQGVIKKSGGPELAKKIEEDGYDSLLS